MQQLSGLDAAFLAMETHAVFGHVGSVCIYDGATALTLADVTAHVESRLPLLPPFRRRLETVPLGLDQPYWIEDENFDIEYHVREIALPAPGGYAQLSEQAARLHARPLDRSRPLWELYLISGLEGGRQAVYSKVHHAAIDGVSGNDLMAALLDVTPDGRVVPPVERIVERSPSAAYMIGRGVLALTGHPFRAVKVGAELVRSAPKLVSMPAPVEKLLRRDRERPLSSPGLRAPRLPFNASITPHRRWAFGDVSLDDVKAVKNAAGATVNDVVMALCAGALRRWLIDHQALPDGPTLAAVPVSIRTEAQQGSHGNQISTMIAALPTNFSDPKVRVEAAREAMRAAKDNHGALPATLLQDVTQFAMPALAAQAGRVAARLRLTERLSPFNLFISNVPGPPVPLWMAGTKLLGYYPLSALADGQGLNITVISYGGNLNFGIIACRELVPDVDLLLGYLQHELDLLLDAYGLVS